MFGGVGGGAQGPPAGQVMITARAGGAKNIAQPGGEQVLQHYISGGGGAGVVHSDCKGDGIAGGRRVIVARFAHR